eukprot:scaffold152_cov383-Prasinococcus_capsulatus_cf.AAC.3
MSSMKPIALAAREPSGPALMVFTRTPHLRPASHASTGTSEEESNYYQQQQVPASPHGPRTASLAIQGYSPECEAHPLRGEVGKRDGRAARRHERTKSLQHGDVRVGRGGESGQISLARCLQQRLSHLGPVSERVHLRGR